MRRLLSFLGTMAAGAAMCGAQQQPPFSVADEFNRGLPKWIRFGGEFRARFEGYEGGGFKPDTSDAYLLTRVRLDFTIQPSKWLKLYAQGQDSRAIEKEPGQPPYENTWDIHQAFADLGNPEKGRFGVRAGRQEINIGDQRLVGSSNWTNTARTFDAVRAFVTFGSVKVDAFAASVVNAVNDTWDHHQQSNNLHGLHAEITSLVPNATIEPYVFWRLQRGVRGEAGPAGNLDEKVPGIRWVGKLPRKVEYQMEMVQEVGHYGSDPINAWASHWVLTRTFSATWSPRPWIEYNYATGDKNPKDGVRGTFDQLYPTAHDKYGLSDQVGWKNIKDLRGGFEVKPRRNVTAYVEYNNWYLASRYDALYNTSSTAIARSATGTAGTHAGQELDLVATWTIDKPLQAGAGFGHIFPGEFLKNTTPGRSYNYPYIFVGYKF